ISTEFAWRCQQSQCQQISSHGYKGTCRLYLGNKIAIIFDRTIIVGILNNGAKKTSIDICLSVITFYNFNSYRDRTGYQNVFCLRENLSIYKKFRPFNMILFIEKIEEHSHGLR